MDRKKKIGVVLNRYPVLSETFIKTFLNHLKDFDVYLFTNLEQAEVPFRSSRVLPYLHRIPKSYEFWSYLRVCFLVFWRFERLLQLRRDGLSLKQILVNANIWTTAKLDVLHFPFANLIFQRAQFAAVVGAKQTLSFRGSDINVFPLYHNLSYATVWPLVDKVQCNSVELRDKLQLHNIPKDMPVHIIPSALRPELYQDETSKEREWEAPWQFLSVGRLHWVKDYPLALRALSHLKEEGIDFTYRIVGAGSELEHLLFIRNLYGLDKEVEFLGAQGADTIASLLQRSHIFLVSSLAEGFSNVALEAQAFGLPCVVTGVGGMLACVEQGKTGLIVKDRGSKSFAQAIKTILMNASQFDSEYMSTRIKNTFNQQNQAEAWQQFFHKI